VSRWDAFPYVSTGKDLGKRPLWVQVLVFAVLATFWIAVGIVSHQTWLVAVGAPIVVGLLIKLVQRRRAQDK